MLERFRRLHLGTNLYRAAYRGPPSPGDRETVDLSAIIITRNEEAHVAACLTACLAAIGRATNEGLLETTEVVLSDSASSDRTVEIARGFPITIVQLLPSWPRSAGAGRYVGLRHAKGDLVLFIDGDYVISDEWLPAALRALEGHLEVAAVCGTDIEELTGESLLLRYERGLMEAAIGEPEAVPVGLYRRSALTAAGGINPFLKGAEDRDLAYRLRSAGYKLSRLPLTMGVHRWSDEGSLDYVTYFRSVLVWSLGDGQVFRARRTQPLVARDMRRRYLNVRYLENYLLTVGLGTLMLTGILAIASEGFRLLLLLHLGTAVLLAARSMTGGRSFSKVVFHLHVIPYTFVRHPGFLIGLLRRPKPPCEYPSGERLIQSST